MWSWNVAAACARGSMDTMDSPQSKPLRLMCGFLRVALGRQPALPNCWKLFAGGQPGGKPGRLEFGAFAGGAFAGGSFRSAFAGGSFAPERVAHRGGVRSCQSACFGTCARKGLSLFEVCALSVRMGGCNWKLSPPKGWLFTASCLVLVSERGASAQQQCARVGAHHRVLLTKVVLRGQHYT